MDYLVENVRPEHAFTMVPVQLIEDHTLSADARLALIYICSRPSGYLMRVSEIRSVMGLGDHAWRRVSKELRARGAIVIQKRTCRATGKIIGTVLQVSWAEWCGIPRAEDAKPKRPQPRTRTETSVSHESETNGRYRQKRRDPPSENHASNKRERSKKERAARASYEKWREWSARTGGGSYGDWLDTEEGKAALREEQGSATHDA